MDQTIGESGPLIRPPGSRSIRRASPGSFQTNSSNSDQISRKSRSIRQNETELEDLTRSYDKDNLEDDDIFDSSDLSDWSEQPQQSEFWGISYTWWIVIVVVIIIAIVGISLLIWWSNRSPDSQTKPTNTSGGSNNPSPTIPIDNTPINNPNNPSIINPPVNIPPTPINPSNPSGPIITPVIPVPPQPSNRITPGEMGYPILNSSSIVPDPFNIERNIWVPINERPYNPYPLSFHLARLYMRIGGKKYYLQFNDPYKPDAWPDPSGELFIWTQTPSQIDVYTSHYQDLGRTKGIRLIVYQHPTQQEPKPGARIIYSGSVLKNNNIRRLSTTDNNGIVYLNLENNLIYLTLWTVLLKSDGSTTDDTIMHYYVKDGYGRFLTEEDAAKEKLDKYQNYPLGIENAPVDRKIYDS